MTEQQYNDLWQMTEEAADRLITCEGRSGIHYELISVLKIQHNKIAMTREEAVKIGRQLCDEYMIALLADENE